MSGMALKKLYRITLIQSLVFIPKIYLPDGLCDDFLLELYLKEKASFQLTLFQGLCKFIDWKF